MASKKSVTTSSTSHTGGGGDGVDCDIVIDCDLSGIRPGVLAGVREGDSLSVRIEPGEVYRSVVCVTEAGDIVGALTAFPGHGRVMRCLDRGMVYRVVARVVGTGHCRVMGGLAP